MARRKNQPLFGPVSLPPQSGEDPVIGGIRASLKGDRVLFNAYLAGLQNLVAAYKGKYSLPDTPAMWQEIQGMAPPANLPADPDDNDGADLKNLRGAIWNNQHRDLGVEYLALLFRVFREAGKPLGQQAIQKLFAFLSGSGGSGPRLP